MTQTRVPPVLVTGATGRIGRAVVGLLTDAGAPVRRRAIDIYARWERVSRGERSRR
jgi:nucleoside-diphosphate-sugar epimerase